MKKIKAIFCDLDGTLLDNKTKLPHPIFNNHYLSLFKKNKIHFILITGRMLQESLSIFENLNSDFEAIPYIVGTNGAQIYDTKKASFILNKHFSNTSTKSLYNALNELNSFNPQTQIIFCTSDNRVIFWPDDKFVFNALKNSKILEDLMQKPDGHRFFDVSDEVISHRATILHDTIQPQKVAKIDLKILKKLSKVVVIVYNGEIEIVQKFLKRKLNKIDEIDVSFSSGHSVEISLSSFTKGASMEKVAKLLNVNLENVLICGDSGNDISMFLKAPENSCCPSWANVLVKNIVKKQYDGLASEWVLKAFDQYALKSCTIKK